MQDNVDIPVEDTKITKEGWMVASTDSHISRWCEEHGKLDFDNFIVPFFVNKMHEGDVVIDGGGNIGDHALAYSKAVGKRGSVVSIEAGALAYKCLKHNIARFPDNNVMGIQAALGEVGGKPVKLDVIENVGASHCVQLQEKDLIEGGTYITTLAIDYIRGQIGKKIDFIKLDVEGWEVKALIGAGNTLKHDRPKLMIEVNQGALERQGDSIKSLYALLAYHKYTWKVIQPDCTENSIQYDIFCEPAPVVEILKPDGSSVLAHP